MKILTRPLVDGMILCKELGQDLFVLNESSRLIWQAHAAGIAEGALPQVLVEHYGISLEVARQDCTRALAEWRAAGLLEEPAKGTLLAGVLAGMLLRLEVEEGDLATILRSLFQPLLDGVARRVEANQGLELRLKGSGEAIYLEERGDQPAGPLNRDQAIEQVLVRITDAVYRLTAWRMGLHAASVDLGKGAVLLSGQSGSGKSTLSAALVLRGHRLLADDISYLSLADMQVLPFALPIVLKEGSWTAFPALEKALAGGDTFQRFGRRVRFLTPPADKIARQPATVRQILFPRFVAGANLTSEEVSPVAAISAIWQASCRIGCPLDQEGLEQLGRWLEETPAHRLTYGSSEEAAQWIEERLA